VGRAVVAIGVVVAVQSLGAAASSAAGMTCHTGWPVVAHQAGGKVQQAALPRVCAGETGYATSESTLAVTSQGTLLYSPAHTENSLARSLDGGDSWTLTYPQDMQYTALWNTVDPYVTVDRRTGRIFWVRATGDLRTAPVIVSESPLPYQVPTAVAYAHGFQVYSSSDEGRSWLTADYQHENMGDWEKVFVGPPSSAPGSPRPLEYPDIVYVCANAPFEVSGPGRGCYRSLDGGATFGFAGYVFPSATAPSDTCPALAANTGVVASDGTVYQPQTCRNGAYIAVSRDEGGSYTWLPVSGAPGTSGLGGGYQLAIDSADNLYALWQSGDQLELTVSRDGGRTWSAPMQIAAPGLRAVTIPALAAGSRGQVAVAYYASTGASSKALTAYVTETRNALDPQPLFYSGALNDPAHPIYTDYGFNASPRADYVGGAFDSTGTFWAGVVKQLGAPDADGKVATTGYVGRLDFGSGPSSTRAPSHVTAAPCVDTRKFSFRVHQPRGGRVVAVTVYVDGRRIRHMRGHRLTRIVLRRLPQGLFTVRIVATTSRQSRTVSVRRYRGCRKGRPHTHVHHR
jgi:hypothetical protein